MDFITVKTGINPIEEKRFARFRVSFSVLRDGYPDMQSIFRNMVVLKAENDFATDCVMYTVAGENFEPVGDGEIPPEYEVIISAKKGIEFIHGEEKFKFQKKRRIECKW